MSIQNFLGRKENYQNLSNQAMLERAKQEQAILEAEGMVERADINAVAQIKAAKYGAEATVAQGAAQGQASMFSGIANGFSGLGGALKGKFGGGIPTGNTGNTTYTGYSGAGQGELLAPLSTGTNAVSKLNSFLGR